MNVRHLLRPLVLAIAAVLWVATLYGAALVADAWAPILPGSRLWAVSWSAHMALSFVLVVAVIGGLFFEPSRSGVARWRGWLSEKQLDWGGILWAFTAAALTLWYFGSGLWAAWQSWQGG